MLVQAGMSLVLAFACILYCWHTAGGRKTFWLHGSEAIMYGIALCIGIISPCIGLGQVFTCLVALFLM